MSEFLSDLIFQRSLKEKLQFEGAFAPILATLVGLTAPSGIQGWFILGAAIGLVFIAFLRWLTFTGRFANEKLFIEQTVRPTELFAIIGVVQILKTGAEQLVPLSSFNIVQLTAAVSVIGSVLFILFIELVFGTYRLGWGAHFYLRYRDAIEKTGDIDSADDVIQSNLSLRELVETTVFVILGRCCLETAYYALKDAIPDKGRDKYIEELAEFVDSVQEEKTGGRNLGMAGTFITGSVIVLPMFLAVGWGLSLIFSTLGSMLLVLVVMRLTKHIVGYSYIAFGTLRFDQFITTNLRSVGLLSSYTLIVYLLFFYTV